MSRIPTGNMVPLAPRQYGTSQENSKTKDHAMTRYLPYQSEVVEVFVLLLCFQDTSHPAMKISKRPYTFYMSIYMVITILKLTPFLEAPRQDRFRREVAYL